MTTPRGLRMSVAMTNCGDAGWLSDRRGYRYDAIDPQTHRPWPAMPDVFAGLARRAASAAGFEGFAPDACLINRYEPGTRLTLHQDRDEQDFAAPIVSVSLGLPATFLWGGAATHGQAASGASRAWRRRRVGRPRAAELSRHRHAARRPSPTHRKRALQPDLSSGGPEALTRRRRRSFDVKKRSATRAPGP